MHTHVASAILIRKSAIWSSVILLPEPKDMVSTKLRAYAWRGESAAGGVSQQTDGVDPPADTWRESLSPTLDRIRVSSISS